MNLTAGPFTIFYDNGFLRHIKYGRDEILRMIYFAFRDENWGTLEKTIENEKVQTNDRSFSVNYDCFNVRDNERVFQWKISITGSSKGEITFNIQGKALVDIKKNRAGFCVLHPLENTVLEAVEITHSDGTESSSTFPVLIDPENPFKNIRSMRWQYLDHRYELQFEGDIFETEDQRNWTDSSFKTFCTPLDKPFPVELKKNEEVHQKIVFKPVKKLPLLPTRKRDMRITVTMEKRQIPLLGTSFNASQPMDGRAMELLQALGLNHLRFEIDVHLDGWKDSLDKASEAAIGTGMQIELVLHVDEKFKVDLKSVFEYVISRKLPVLGISVFNKNRQVTSQETIDFLDTLKKEFPSIRIGAGTNYNFTEVNRNRFDPKNLDFVSYSVQPQEHAFDNLTLIENVEAQADTVRTIKTVYGNSYDVHVSPVTLRKRDNPYATDHVQAALSEEHMSDPRQSHPFCAVWTLGSIKHLNWSGTKAVTYYQVKGPQGMMGLDAQPYPVYHALKLFLDHRETVILGTYSSDPLVVDGMFFLDGSGIIWNYTGEPQKVVVQGGKTVELGAWEYREIELWV